MKSSTLHRGFAISDRAWTGLSLGIGLAVLATAACNPFRRDPAVQVTTDDTVNSRWHANLASPSTLAGAVQINGTASMAPSPDGTKTDITLDMANASPGGVHPWEAHYGQCGAGMDHGAFGSSDGYQPLKVDSDGRAHGTASVPLTTSTTGRYFVVVRASAENPGMILACGNLAPPTR
jgi:hypothetical protein